MKTEKIKNGQTYLGIELGSTRIKACLIDDTYSPIANGSYEWENAFDGKYWTYSLDSIHTGVRECFKSLCDDVMKKYNITLETIGGMGISAMMHGYLAFDKNDNLLVPFRTWRNTVTEDASEKLTQLFNFNIPQRWSIAHLYQAILNNEPHVSQIAYITTLSGYIHYLLTGKHEIGIGDASGIFPLEENDYNSKMLDKFRVLVKENQYEWDIKDILPKIKSAGEGGSYLTESGAKFLDPTGNLKTNILVCPPEGDAGTGMVATNAVSPKSGNISAGTSVFSMLVLEKQLKNTYPEIDIVATPDGFPVAMVHCNNCCNELDTWVNIFDEFSRLLGVNTDKSTLYELLYKTAMTGNCTGIIAYNYLSGEHITQIKNGKPLYFRLPEVKMTLAGFVKAQLYSSVTALSIGMDILFNKEKIHADKFSAHGGLFKVEGVAQQILANALNTPISVMTTAGEGGAWGMALLSAFASEKTTLPLNQWLDEKVFSNLEISVLTPQEKGTQEFENYKKLYKSGLNAEFGLEEVR